MIHACSWSRSFSAALKWCEVCLGPSKNTALHKQFLCGLHELDNQQITSQLYFDIFRETTCSPA